MTIEQKTKDINTDDIIASLRGEMLKEYVEYDGNQRKTKRDQTISRALDGDFALETRYYYDGTSQRIIYIKEDIVSWDASWEQS